MNVFLLDRYRRLYKNNTSIFFQQYGLSNGVQISDDEEIEHNDDLLESAGSKTYSETEIETLRRQVMYSFAYAHMDYLLIDCFRRRRKLLDY